MAKQVIRYECSCCFKLFRTMEECRDHEAERATERAAYDAKVAAAEAEALRLARESAALRLLVRNGFDAHAVSTAGDMLDEVPWTPDCSGWYEAMKRRMTREARNV